MNKVAPSILSANFARLGDDVKRICDCGADYVHIDVMDGSFVPEITIGANVVKALRPITDKVFDVHLMVEHPETQIDKFAMAGADIITFHVEAAVHAHRIIQQIHDAGCRAGISLNPGTSISAVEELLNDLDMVLIMSVNPGYGGQKFIPASIDKIKRLHALMTEKGVDCDIEVDGGVNLRNCQALYDAGATVLVAGSAVFGEDDIPATIQALHGNCW